MHRGGARQITLVVHGGRHHVKYVDIISTEIRATSGGEIYTKKLSKRYYDWECLELGHCSLGSVRQI